MTAVDPRLIDELERLGLPLRVVLDVHARLEAGAAEYGEASFDRTLDDLLTEVAEEFLDAIGWTTIALARLRPLAASPDQPPSRPDAAGLDALTLQAELDELCRSASGLARRCERLITQAAAIKDRP
ncbi:hypothetical protein SK069_05880 [Patulibacter brassicae]|uniref:Uncharacterized protein n=1 Tax=Patulibacter brassicae TaxID=1705717 RepID=A0ABU4VIZ4_9ACTN|nr:hypothetical protein [Patulibacter brassicae]MDX8151114.1 hypothetical protein [Patulibacter brassicae]